MTRPHPFGLRPQRPPRNFGEGSTELRCRGLLDVKTHGHGRADALGCDAPCRTGHDEWPQHRPPLRGGTSRHLVPFREGRRAGWGVNGSKPGVSQRPPALHGPPLRGEPPFADCHAAGSAWCRIPLYQGSSAIQPRTKTDGVSPTCSSPLSPPRNFGEGAEGEARRGGVWSRAPLNTSGSSADNSIAHPHGHAPCQIRNAHPCDPCTASAHPNAEARPQLTVRSPATK